MSGSGRKPLSYQRMMLPQGRQLDRCWNGCCRTVLGLSNGNTRVWKSKCLVPECPIMPSKSSARGPCGSVGRKRHALVGATTVGQCTSKGGERCSPNVLALFSAFRYPELRKGQEWSSGFQPLRLRGSRLEPSTCRCRSRPVCRRLPSSACPTRRFPRRANESARR